MKLSKPKNHVLRGILWTYGAQIFTTLAQFFYAAVSSRSISSSGFGLYAIALTVGGLATLLSTGGLAQTVGRLQDVASNAISKLFIYGLKLGSLGSVAILVTAPLWALIWGNEEATPLIQILAVATFVSPVLGLMTGLSRRLGNFRGLAIITISCNVLAMLVGAICVGLTHNPACLLVSPILSQTSIAAMLIWTHRGLLTALREKPETRANVQFSRKIIFASIGAYLVGNSSNWAASKLFGTSFLGQWNRADVLSTVPAHQIQSAVLQSVYPEFRHAAGNPSHASAVWTRTLIYASLVSSTIAAAGAALVPSLVPMLFGKGWEQAASLVPMLFAIAAIQLPTVILSAAIESLGWFKLVWLGHAVQGILNVICITLAWSTSSFNYILLGVFLGFIARHAVELSVLAKRNYARLARTAKSYLLIWLLAFLGYIFLSSLVSMIVGEQSDSFSEIRVSLGLTVFALVVTCFRRTLLSILKK